MRFLIWIFRSIVRDVGVEFFVRAFIFFSWWSSKDYVCPSLFILLNSLLTKAYSLIDEYSYKGHSSPEIVISNETTEVDFTFYALKKSLDDVDDNSSRVLEFIPSSFNSRINSLSFSRISFFLELSWKLLTLLSLTTINNTFYDEVFTSKC